MDAYLPGYDDRTIAMLAARTAERLAFVPTARLAGARVVDLGCGPGTLTAVLARRIGAGGRLLAVDIAPDARRATARALRDAGPRCTVLGGSATALPLAASAVDVVVAHALLEHLPEPVAVLAEIRRVLRPDGVLAVASSDWSGAFVDPQDAGTDPPHATTDVRTTGARTADARTADARTADARTAVDGYRHARRRAGADPDAGARLGAWLVEAGFAVTHQEAHHREDLVGADLARYIADRLAPGHARAAAQEWASRTDPPRVRQRWVEVLAVPAEP